MCECRATGSSSGPIACSVHSTIHHLSGFGPLCVSMRECGAVGSASCHTACPVHSTIRHISGSGRIAAGLLHPGCPSLPLPPVWMSVSSLSPWLLDFCAIRFSVSSGCSLFLNCCCPPLGRVRRCSVSTYASFLARSCKHSFKKATGF